MVMRTAVITGSSRGIGRAIAFRLAHDGCNIVVNCSRSGDELEETIAAIERIGVRAIGVQADVSEPSGCDRLIGAALERFGSIDVLVNNAGRAHVGLFSDMRPEEIADVVSVNLLSAMYCARLCVPVMVRRRHGSIINISSMWGSAGASCEAVYSGAKGGVNAFTKALAKELGPSGVRVNAISCGVIDTGMNAFLSPQEADGLAEQIPLSRFGSAAEVAEAAAFLASDAASYVTGQILGVDGGMM